jgi:hypothetical protein
MEQPDEIPRRRDGFGHSRCDPWSHTIHQGRRLVAVEIHRRHVANRFGERPSRFVHFEEGDQLLVGNCRIDVEVSDADPHEGLQMGGDLERFAYLLREHAKVEAPGTVDLDREVGRAVFQQLDPVCLDLSRFTVDILPLAGKHVEGRPLVLQSGIHGGNLLPFTEKTGEDRPDVRFSDMMPITRFERFARRILCIGPAS